MSKNTKGFMGDQIGKLGPAVGRRWKGLMVYSAYQAFVHNPKTLPQVKTRAKFAVLGRLGGAFLKPIRFGFARQAAKNNTEIGVFVMKNYDNVMVSASGAVQVAYDEIVLSQGKRNNVLFGALDWSTPQKVVVPIVSPNSDTENPMTDRVVLVAYCPDLQQCLTSELTETRASSDVQVKYPAAWATSTVHVWGFVIPAVDSVSKLASDSIYLGSGTAA